MSDTYMGFNFETEVTLNVVPRKLEIAKTIEGYLYDTLPISEENLERALNRLPMNVGEVTTKKKLENVFVEFFAQKEARKAALQEVKSKAAQELGSKDADPKSEMSEMHRDENHRKSNDDALTKELGGTKNTEEFSRNDTVAQTMNIRSPVNTFSTDVIRDELVEVLSKVTNTSEPQPDIPKMKMAPSSPTDIEVAVSLSSVNGEYVDTSENSTRNQNNSTEDLKPKYSPKVKATAKEACHSLWSRVSKVEQILSHGLEDFIPNTMKSSTWIIMEPWNLKKDYMSEWILPWDCEDDLDENWVDMEETVENNKVPEFHQWKMSLGRDGGYATQSMEDSPTCVKAYSSEEIPAVILITAGITADVTSTSSEIEPVITPVDSEDESGSFRKGKIGLSDSATSDESISLPTPPDLEETMIEELSTHRVSDTYGNDLDLVVTGAYKGIVVAPTAPPTPEDE